MSRWRRRRLVRRGIAEAERYLYVAWIQHGIAEAEHYANEHQATS